MIMSKRTALDRLYKLAKAEEEREKKLKQAEEERKKKIEAEKNELLHKVTYEFLNKAYKKYLKANNISSSKISIFDFIYHLNSDDIGWVNLQKKPQVPPVNLTQQPVQQQPQQPVQQPQRPVRNHGGNVTNTPTGE